MIRAYLLCSSSLRDGQTDSENGIGAKLILVGCTVKAVQKRIDLGLVLDINGFLDQSRSDDGVDIVNGLADALASPLGLVTISELAGLVLTY